jgi:HSP20 family protein
MALVRWEPRREMAALRHGIDRLFKDFEDFFRRGHLPGESARGPAVEVADTPDTVVVKALIPGVHKEDLHVEITSETLTLRGECKEDAKKEHYYQQEIRYGPFTRTIPLPAPVESDKATAQCKDGMLEITIPKAEQAKVKRIPIQAA